MATRSGKQTQKSKEVTWSERDLAKHVLKDKKAASSVGSPKSSPRVSGGKTSRVSGKASLSSTAPVDRVSSVARGREKLSSTTTTASSRVNSHSSSSGGREGKTGGQDRRKKGETLAQRDTPAQRERERSKESSRGKEKTRVSDGGERREQGTRRNARDKDRGEVTGSGRDKDGGRKDGGRRGGSEHGRGSRQNEKGRDDRREERREERRERGKVKIVETTSSSSPLRENQKSKIERKPPDGATPRPMVEVREDDGEVVEEEFEYEEEFEDDDYNDDEFEEDIEEESESENENDVTTKKLGAVSSDPSSRINLVEIMEAINAENRHIAVEGEKEGEGGGGEGPDVTSTNKPHLEPSHPEVGMSTSLESLGSQRSMTKRKFFDFSSAKKREENERVARVTRKRGQELLSMIELDVVTFDLFELQPLTEYELYMHSFGAEGTQQVACQTGEDTTEVEVQTEVVERREKWVQWPPEDLKGYGGPLDEEDEITETMTTGGTVRLASFLKRASQVMSVLLEENVVPSGQSPLHSNQSEIQFCSSRTQIHPPHQLQGCTLTSMEYSPIHPHLVMTMHTPTAEVCPDSVPRGGGAVCVWSTREPSQPQYLLVCESAPVCGCFSSHKTALVISGNDDGTLVVWDLREPVAMHTRPAATPTGHSLIPRAPTFSTAALLHKHNHHSPVTTITSITTSTLHISQLTNDTETETIGLSFQLASLDRSGLLIIWVAVETKPHPQGSESDLGLVPGGRVKLVWSISLDTVRSLRSSSIPVQTLCVRFHPTDSNHLFVGTDEGTVLHQTRYGSRPIPRRYQSQLEAHCPCDVTSLNFSPWQPDYFLAGYSNGNITLYHTKKEHPLVTWSESTNGIAVQQVEWAWHHPGLFLALDAGSNLYMWSVGEKVYLFTGTLLTISPRNLLERDGKPTGIHQRKEKTPRILSFRLSPPSPPSPPSPSLTFCLSDSTVEIHQLSTPASPSTESQLLSNFTNYLQTL